MRVHDKRNVSDKREIGRKSRDKSGQSTIGQRLASFRLILVRIYSSLSPKQHETWDRRPNIWMIIPGKTIFSLSKLLPAHCGLTSSRITVRNGTLFSPSLILTQFCSGILRGEGLRSPGMHSASEQENSTEHTEGSPMIMIHDARAAATHTRRHSPLTTNESLA